jgi:hypothetical protein
VSSIIKIILLVVWLNLLLVLRIFAAPPFLTDDPEPTDYQHWEAYLFATGDHTGGGYTINGPGAELDYGAFPNTQLTLGISMTTVGGDGMQTASGFGDVAFSVKYRFLHETNGWPELAVFPGVTLPTGDAARGLGNGRAMYQVPLWAQKSFGAWKVDAGGGAFFNSVPGERDYPYGGLLLQRDLGKHLSLGGEIFAQGQDADRDHGFAALNFGGSYNFMGHFSMQASAGHSVIGDEHTVWYFGLYWTW